MIEDDLSIEDRLCWKTTLDRRHSLMYRNSTMQGVGEQRVKGFLGPFVAKAFRSKTKKRLEFDTEDQVTFLPVSWDNDGGEGGELFAVL